MPKVKPLTESGKIAERWKAQDNAFSEQFERICKLSGMTRVQMAAYLDVSVPTLLKYMEAPDWMPKRVERKLVLLAEKLGMDYNPGLGGGTAKNVSFSMGGMLMMIDPETGYVKAIS